MVEQSSLTQLSLITKLSPLVEGLQAEGKKNMSTMRSANVAHLAGLAQQLLDEWALLAPGVAKTTSINKVGSLFLAIIYFTNPH